MKKIFKRIVVFGLIMLLFGGLVPSYLSEMNQTTYGTDDIWWPLAHQNVRNTRCSQSTCPDNGEVLWKYVTGENMRQTTPIVVDDKLFIGFYEHHTGNGSVLCLNADTGEKLWEYPAGEIIHPVAYDSGRVVAMAKTGIYPVNASLVCLNASDGTLIWNHIRHKATGMVPVIHEGKVYVGTSDYQATNNLTCYDLASGAEIWRYSPGTYVWIPSDAIGFDSGRLYLTTQDLYANDHFLVCINATTTAEIWSKQIDFTDLAAPLIHDGSVYMATLDNQENNHLYCFNSETGQKQWSTKFDKDLYFYGTPALWNSSLFLLGEHINYDYSKVFRIDASNGDVIWMKNISEIIETSCPAVSADGKLVFGSHPLLQCWDAVNGDILWTYTMDYSGIYNSAAIADGKVFFPDYNGEVYAFHDLNDPPNQPTITGPSLGELNQEYQYTVSTVDPDGNEIYYFVDWGDNTTTDWVGPYSSGSSVEMTHSWDAEGTYDVKVKAKDSLGSESIWSEVLTVIIIDNDAPSIPIIDGPTEGNAGESYDYEIVAEDPEGLDLFYWVEWGDDSPPLGWIGPVSSGESITVSHIYETKGTYELKAKAKDGLDLESDWGTLDVTMPISLPFVNLPLLQWFSSVFEWIRAMLNQLFSI